MMVKPNILFIIADQHNARMMGAAGDLTARTPNLDKLAERGVLFNKAYCVSPICSPSRISIYKGMEPAQHGYYGNANYALEDECPGFLPLILRKSGYETALVGRSHMVYKWDHQAFGRVSYMNFADCDRYRLEDNPWLMELLKNNIADNYDICLPASQCREGAFVTSMPLEMTEEMWVAREAKDFLKTRDRSKPFYLHIGFDHPHDPVAPPLEFDSMFEAEMVKLPDNYTDSFEGKPEFMYKYRHQLGGYPYTPRDERHLRWLVAKQYALIALMDYSIGQIINELDKQGELDNTLIIYTADHGDFAGEHGMVMKGLGIYESVHRVPCIVSWPGHYNAGVSMDCMIENIDLYSTMLRSAGLNIPQCAAMDLTGLLSQVDGDTFSPALRDHVVCDWLNTRALRTDKYRIVLYDCHEAGELYNLMDDPGEVNNLWNSCEYESVKKELVRLLDKCTLEKRTVRTQYPDSKELKHVKDWFAEDSPIYAMWKYGLKWSQIEPYLEDMPSGGKRLKCNSSELAKKFPFILPEVGGNWLPCINSL